MGGLLKRDDERGMGYDGTTITEGEAVVMPPF
jgi:hypothetical protein